MKKLILLIWTSAMCFVASAQKVSAAKVQKDTLVFAYDKEILVPSEYVVGEFDLAPFSRPTFGITFRITGIHNDLAVNKILNLGEFLKHVITMKETDFPYRQGPSDKILNRMNANVVILVLGCGKDRIFLEMHVTEWME